MYRMERVEGTSRTVYLVYSNKMGFLATLSWLNGRLAYEYHQPEMWNVPASEFEDGAKRLDAEVRS